jgi:hypothetical protein
MHITKGEIFVCAQNTTRLDRGIEFGRSETQKWEIILFGDQIIQIWVQRISFGFLRGLGKTSLLCEWPKRSLR